MVLTSKIKYVSEVCDHVTIVVQFFSKRILDILYFPPGRKVFANPVSILDPKPDE